MNTPNKITLSRILLIPLVIFFYLANYIPYGKLVAALIFVVACLTDFLDGKIARKTGQVTDLGKFFDAIADKVLIMTGMFLIVAYPVAGSEAIIKPLWLGIVCMILMLAREFIISALRQIAASKGIVMAADKGGKIKAAFQDVTISLYMFYAFFVAEIYPKAGQVSQGMKTANAVIGIVLMVMLVVSTVLTITSGVGYIIRNRKVFAETKHENIIATEEVKPEEVELESNDIQVEDNKSDEVILSTPDKTPRPRKQNTEKKSTTKKSSTAKVQNKTKSTQAKAKTSSKTKTNNKPKASTSKTKKTATKTNNKTKVK